jgi:hypothetical protein
VVKPIGYRRFLCYEQDVKLALRILVLSLAILNVCSSAFADGKVFSQAMAFPATTPDQRAMLHFEKGVERLVIQTSFVGAGSNFAWVVPFPSPPKIDAVQETFFSTLNSTFQPKVISQPSRLWLLFLPIGGFISLTIFARRQKHERLLIWCFSTVLICGGFLALIPHFVKARGEPPGATDASVKILGRKSVGIYDTVTLSSKDGGALLDWLNANQFSTPTNALPIISSYASQGWAFAAAILHPTNTVSIHTRPHPLAFTFETERAVYPLRLTGIENDACAIELFVFGPDRAEAEHFKVEYCGKPKPGTESGDEWKNKMGFETYGPGEFRILDNKVRELTSPSSVTTKLVGTLSPQQMRSDAYLKWVPFQPALPTLYSYKAARNTALDWFVVIVIAAGLFIQFFAPRMTRKNIWRSLAWTVLVAAVAGLIQYAALPKTEVRIVRNYYAAINNVRQLEGALDQLNIETKGHAPMPFAAFKAQLDQYVKGGAKNPFTDQPLLEGKTPGNITLDTNANGLDVIWYNLKGSPLKLSTFENSSK